MTYYKPYKLQQGGVPSALPALPFNQKVELIKDHLRDAKDYFLYGGNQFLELTGWPTVGRYIAGDPNTHSMEAVTAVAVPGSSVARPIISKALTLGGPQPRGKYLSATLPLNGKEVPFTSENFKAFVDAAYNRFLGRNAEKAAVKSAAIRDQANKQSNYRAIIEQQARHDNRVVKDGPKRGLYTPRTKVTEPVMGNTSGTPLDKYINVNYPWVKEKSVAWNTKQLKKLLDESYYYTQTQLDDFINYKYLK